MSNPSKRRARLAAGSLSAFGPFDIEQENPPLPFSSPAIACVVLDILSLPQAKEKTEERKCLFSQFLCPWNTV